MAVLPCAADVFPFHPDPFFLFARVAWRCEHEPREKRLTKQKSREERRGNRTGSRSDPIRRPSALHCAALQPISLHIGRTVPPPGAASLRFASAGRRSAALRCSSAALVAVRPHDDAQSEADVAPARAGWMGDGDGNSSCGSAGRARAARQPTVEQRQQQRQRRRAPSAR